MSSYDSGPGTSEPVPLVRGKENRWMERIQIRLGREQLWEIVSGEETPPNSLISNHTYNTSTGTPTVNLAIDFDRIQREFMNKQNQRSPFACQNLQFKFTMEARDWKGRHDRANYFIIESLTSTEYGLPKAKQMEVFRDNMAQAWKAITTSFNIGN